MQCKFFRDHFFILLMRIPHQRFVVIIVSHLTDYSTENITHCHVFHGIILWVKFNVPAWMLLRYHTETLLKMSHIAKLAIFFTHLPRLSILVTHIIYFIIWVSHSLPMQWHWILAPPYLSPLSKPPPFLPYFPYPPSSTQIMRYLPDHHCLLSHSLEQFLTDSLAF